MKPNTQSIMDLIADIDNDSIALPEFQRDFRWGREKTFDLFDSFVRDIFIGSIIYLEPDFQVTIRNIDTRIRYQNGKRYGTKPKPISLTKETVEKKVKEKGFRLILDGQQRITSIYRALKKKKSPTKGMTDIDSVWMIIKREEELSQEIKEKNISKRNLEDVLYKFTGAEDKDRLSIKLSDVYETAEGFLKEETQKTLFFNKLKFIASLEVGKEKEYFNQYRIYTQKCQELLKDTKLISYYSLEISLSKCLLFFERSNSRGIQLNFIDILTAKVYQGFKLRTEIDEFNNTHNDYKPLKEDIIIRTLAYYISEGKKVDKKYILATLDDTHFSQNWTILVKHYLIVLRYLQANHFIISHKWIPYDSMLISLIIFSLEIKGNFDNLSNEKTEFIQFWWWASILSLTYTGAAHDRILLDAKILKLIARGEKLDDTSYFAKLFGFRVRTYEDLYGFFRKTSAIYKGVLNLINYKAEGLVNLANSSKISALTDIEDHHIFPKNYLKKNFNTDDRTKELMDCVVNRTLLNKVTNKDYKAKKPSVYLKGRKAKTLEKHLIPSTIKNGDYDNNFHGFLEERAKKIFALIKDEVLDKQNMIQENYLKKTVYQMIEQ